MRFRLLSGLCLLLYACIPPADGPDTRPIVTDLADSTVRRLYELQNTRAEDSLRAYLSAPAPGLRYQAARAFGSFPAPGATTKDSLLPLLSDPSDAVRAQAAYALGQTGDAALLPALTSAFDRDGAYPAANAALLTALGRTADSATVRLLATTSTYPARDTLLRAAQRWALYYAGLRDVRTPAGDTLMMNTVLDATADAALRHPAAHYLYRVPFPVSAAAERGLREQLRQEPDPVVAMGIIRTLGRSGLPPARVALLGHYEQSDDWRTRVEVLRAFEGFDYGAVRESVIEALRDRHPLVARTAADYLLNRGVEADALLYLQLAEDGLPHGLSTALYRAANRYLPPFLTDYRDRINARLQADYAAADDPYVLAELLRALGEFAWNYRIIGGLYSRTDAPAVRTAAAETLQAISDRPDFDAFFRGSSSRVRNELAGSFQDMIASAEAGPAYHAALALAANPAAYRTAYPSLEWLDAALDALPLPRQLETYREVLTARNALTGSRREAPETKAAAVGAIDWARITGAAAPTARIRTPAGEIRLRLWPEAAPATVSSFLRLAEAGYYDNRVFHRVVPNFVAQGGGPRGDGFGGEDFIVRTETPPLHWDRAGLIGMASAGKDTEGVQFFITHRPVPHLDGNYTIFGEVTEGQDVVDRLVPGSKILRVTAD